MVEPMSLAAGLGGTLSASVTLADLVLGLRNCPAEVKTCFSLVNLINADIQHAVNLRTKHRFALRRMPVEEKRIDDIITSASESLTSIGQLAERLRADANGGKVPFPQRLRWVLGDSASFALRTRDLQAQHTAIQGEIQWLRMLELLAPMQQAHANPPSSFDDMSLWQKNLEDDEVEHKAYIPYRPPRPRKPPAYSLHRVPSTETLVGSIREESELSASRWYEGSTEERRDSAFQDSRSPSGGYENQWSQSTQNNRGSSGSHWSPSVQSTARGLSDQWSPLIQRNEGAFGFQWSPDSKYSPIAQSVEVFEGMSPDPKEESGNEMASFFSEWKEEQDEQKRKPPEKIYYEL